MYLHLCYNDIFYWSKADRTPVRRKSHDANLNSIFEVRWSWLALKGAQSHRKWHDSTTAATLKIYAYRDALVSRGQCENSRRVNKSISRESGEECANTGETGPGCGRQACILTTEYSAYIICCRANAWCWLPNNRSGSRAIAPYSSNKRSFPGGPLGA